MNRPQSALRGYLVAFVSVAVVVLIRRYLLVGVFSNQVPVGLFLVAVILSAWVGGMRAGLLAVGLGVVGAIYSFAGVSDAQPATLVTRMQIGAFAAGGVLTSYVTNLLRTTNWRLADRQRELELQQRRLADEIEHRRQAETALRDREERIRMAVESADIGTWDLNVATRQRQWSDRAKAMFDLPPAADPSTLDFLALLHPDDRQHVAAAIEAALDPRGNGGYQVEYRTLRDDGTIRWVVAKGQAFFQGAGDFRRALRFIGTVIDITERKELEHALHEADRRKNDFLAMLAHELRNPLVPMRNALDIWPALEREPGEMAALRAMMRRQVRQMIRLIDDLLDVSRMTRGKIELRFEPLDLGQVIARAVEAIQPVIHGRDHRLAIETGEPIAMVGDAARLTQVFSNILHNAAKYTDPQGSIELVVGREQDRAVVTVSDNGRGIDPGMLTEIFEPFRQCDSSSNRSDSGLGIGLTLARQIVEMHDGTIEAESAGLGQGSRFVVRLPALAEHELVPAQPEECPPAQPARHRILIVDDVQASAETLATLLRARGHEVRVAFDGVSAIDLVLAHRPEAVFLDVAMPGLDGYEVARRLRARPHLKDVVLVALTGYSDADSRQQALAAGFDHHIVKTADLEELEGVFSAPSAEG